MRITREASEILRLGNEDKIDHFNSNVYFMTLW